MPINNFGRSITETSESAKYFEKWFAKSKVVDCQGRPLVVFHGTDKDFHSFDKECIGDNFRADEVGFFFTSNPKEASDYAENDTIGINKRLNSLVIPAYISLQNPLIIDDSFLKNEGMHPIGIKDDTISFWDTYQGLILEWVSNKKADGIMLVDNTYKLNAEPTRMIVAFEPYQIKSAIGNSGHFNRNDNSLVDIKTHPYILLEVEQRETQMRRSQHRI